jgi:hypothetical protein
MPEWKLCPGFPGYEISRAGKIRRRFVVRGHLPKNLKPWFIRNRYAVVALRRNGKTVKVLVARLVARAFFRLSADREFDHRRRVAATRVQILRGRRGTAHSSRFKGVSRCPGGWLACIKVNGGPTRSLGTFRSERAAARAYDEAARCAWGKVAYQNFPGAAAQR